MHVSPAATRARSPGYRLHRQRKRGRTSSGVLQLVSAPVPRLPVRNVLLATKPVHYRPPSTSDTTGRYKMKFVRIIPCLSQIRMVVCVSTMNRRLPSTRGVLCVAQRCCSNVTLMFVLFDICMVGWVCRDSKTKKHIFSEFFSRTAWIAGFTQP